MFQTPILFIIYKNPKVTKVVFERIRELKPSILFISADGAKSNLKEDIEEIIATREVTELIDWECKVYRRYSDKNLGCKLGVSSAITWFFQNVEQGIILEYDCLPDLSFFIFCEQLLEKYRNVNNVFSISGNNFDFISNQNKTPFNYSSSYSFSNLSKIWGWATWKRAWELFDIEMNDFPDFLANKKIKSLIKGESNQNYWIGKIKDVYEGRNNSTWGFIWLFTLLNNEAYCITPNENLVSNIGFGDGATHAKDKKSIFSNIDAKSITYIIHPKNIKCNYDSDFRFTNYLRNSEMKNEIIVKVKNLIPNVLKELYRKWK